MKPDIKEKWVNALRSDEYPQTKGTLRNSEGFCCLGVLCDLYLKETNQQWRLREKPKQEYRCLNNADVLPKQVQDWAGLKGSDPAVQELGRKPLSYFNDEHDGGKSFKEIADIIDRYF